ncbi:MAG: type II toxin-antitoxin system Phd/YefM family antitoxin [Deltaproteobacteria bacterium]|nr:MAG: type II toxin-antitoxin system Phd/YefM family antitoxin [Deltaproteobacteria bacterium]
MKRVNALDIRNRLGAVLDELERNREPILVSKGRRIRAVLITPEDFERRFLDHLTREKVREQLERIEGVRARRISDRTSLEILRGLRGYGA